MIFTVHQLVEKSWEHKSKAFLLKKAYESVPREANFLSGWPWGTLVCRGGIRSFHEDMRGRVHLEGITLEEIQVQNGLQQGCCMAPVLFHLYTCLAVERWL